MATRKPKQKKKQTEPDKPSKEEYAVAKFLRFNIPAKEGKLMGMTVQYFKANKAVDAMLESKWSKRKEPLFTTRAGCVDYCNILLVKGMFHRAAKMEKKKDRDKKKKKKEGAEDSPQVSQEKKKKKKKEEDDDKKEDEEKKEEKEEEKKEEDKKKKKERKLRLEMHDNQVFKDGDEVYVWIYDPVPFKTFFIGLLLVLGAIGVCLFPLWPPEVRLGVYYLSLAAGGFVVFILSLCVLRMILFCLVWGVTFGRHHFWFLPNLTEDVGFFDSFKPLYKHDKMDRSAVDKSAADKKSGEDKKEDNNGDGGGGAAAVAVEDNKAETTATKEKMEKEKQKEEVEEKEEEEEEEEEKEESGSEGSNDNGYEIVDAEDINEEEDEVEEESEPENEEDAEPKKTK